MDKNIVEKDNSQLKNWLRLNGRDTVNRFKEFEKNDFKKSLFFSG